MLNKTPAGYEITMVRPDLQKIPRVELPEGFKLRNLNHDEGNIWISIWNDADDWVPVDMALWKTEFAHSPEEVTQRCFVVETDSGFPVATASAWNASTAGENRGRVHWVATRKTFSGKGLAKALISHVLETLSLWHDKAVLGTQSNRLAAIKLYLDFGFKPVLDDDFAYKVWENVAQKLEHPSLKLH